jgi:ABC-type transport system substrate-binding protein
VPTRLVPRAFEDITSSQISSEQSRWRGSNYGGYANPAYDQLYVRYVNTMGIAERQRLQADLLLMIAEDLPFIPLYYTTYSGAIRAGIRGPGALPPVQLITTWNIHAWEMD